MTVFRTDYDGGPAASHKNSFVYLLPFVYSLHKGKGVLRIPLPFVSFALPMAGQGPLGKGS